jgi:hypothetical protein
MTTQISIVAYVSRDGAGVLISEDRSPHDLANCLAYVLRVQMSLRVLQPD